MRSFLIVALVAALAVPAFAAPLPMPNLDEYAKLGENLCGLTAGSARVVKLTEWGRRPEQLRRDKVEVDSIMIIERLSDGAALMFYGENPVAAPAPIRAIYGIRRDAKSRWQLFDSLEAARAALEVIWPVKGMYAMISHCR